MQRKSQYWAEEWGMRGREYATCMCFREMFNAGFPSWSWTEGWLLLRVSLCRQTSARKIAFSHYVEESVSLLKAICLIKPHQSHIRKSDLVELCCTRHKKAIIPVWCQIVWVGWWCCDGVRAQGLFMVNVFMCSPKCFFIRELIPPLNTQSDSIRPKLFT